MSVKQLAIFIIVVSVLTVGAVLFIFNSDKSQTPSLAGMSSQNNVVTTEGKQIIEITAKGGYLPGKTVAKANTPTVIKVKTSGTFDCSSALTIPSLGYRINLPPSGETLVDVPPQPEGSTLQGVCSMGMYSFQIAFK